MLMIHCFTCKKDFMVAGFEGPMHVNHDLSQPFEEPECDPVIKLHVWIIILALCFIFWVGVLIKCHHLIK